ncbi:hypothetical protein ACEQ8H_002499 [Pleosporales sp. CAS-2024a]
MPASTTNAEASSQPLSEGKPQPTTPTTTDTEANVNTQHVRPKPFPSLTGGCVCNAVRYRLLTSPLFCYACHCPACQRASGTAFGHFLNIEAHKVQVISITAPVTAVVTKRPGLISRHVECPLCKVELWSNNMLGPAIAVVRVGTLDFPSLMQPDVHIFVESKVEWLRLPEGAKSMKGGYAHRKLWPESSLQRLDACLARWARLYPEQARKTLEEGKEGEGGDGEKTPTAGAVGDGEDDEAFEKRFKETERALHERLEKLRQKLEDESRSKDDLDKLTEKLGLGDAKSEKAVTAKDGIVSEPVD